jgi:hypothetical protein
VGHPCWRCGLLAPVSSIWGEVGGPGAIRLSGVPTRIARAGAPVILVLFSSAGGRCGRAWLGWPDLAAARSGFVVNWSGRVGVRMILVGDGERPVSWLANRLVSLDQPGWTMGRVWCEEWLSERQGFVVCLGVGNPDLVCFGRSDLGIWVS